MMTLGTIVCLVVYRAVDIQVFDTMHRPMGKESDFASNRCCSRREIATGFIPFGFSIAFKTGQMKRKTYVTMKSRIPALRQVLMTAGISGR